MLRQVISALRKPWPEGYVLKIVDGLPTWAPDETGGDGGGVGADVWALRGDGHGAISLVQNPNGWNQYVLALSDRGGPTDEYGSQGTGWNLRSSALSTFSTTGWPASVALEVPGEGVYSFGFHMQLDIGNAGTFVQAGMTITSQSGFAQYDVAGFANWVGDTYYDVGAAATMPMRKSDGHNDFTADAFYGITAWIWTQAVPTHVEGRPSGRHALYCAKLVG